MCSEKEYIVFLNVLTPQLLQTISAVKANDRGKLREKREKEKRVEQNFVINKVINNYFFFLTMKDDI